MTFKEIEAVLGFDLPRSKRYPAWWSNNPSNNPMTKVWLQAGFRTEQVDPDRKRLVFRRTPSPLGHNPAAGLEVGVAARLRAALAGTVRWARDEAAG